MSSEHAREEELVEIGPGDRPRRSAWEENWWAERLSLEKLEAARLLALVPNDSPRVERMLHLEPGTLQKWWDEDQYFQRAAKAAYSEHELGQAATIDFVQGLAPKQREACRLFFENGLKQVEVARKVGVTSRTVRNWLADPVFRRYGQELGRLRAERLTREHDARDSRFWEQLQIRREEALNVLAGALQENDVKVALELVRPWLSGGRKA